MPRHLTAISFGEILWDVLPSGARPGGAPMNVAYHLAKLGWTSSIISRTGQDQHGSELLEVLTNNGLDTSLVQIDPEHQTGIVNATVGANFEVVYDIVKPVAWDFIASSENLVKLVSEADAFIYGSLSARMPVSRNSLLELVEAAKFRVLDINLRAPHFDSQTVLHFFERAQVIKMNEHELPLVSKWLNELTDVKDQMQYIQDHYNVPSIVVTRGGEGAIVLHQGKFAEHPGYPAKVVDTVGSGDAFLAGFLTAHFRGLSIEDTLDVANSMGSFVAEKSGACPAYDASSLPNALHLALSHGNA